MTSIGWHNWVLERAVASPDALALIGPDETLTYKQLAWRASKWANAMVKSGVKPGQVVVTRMPREFDAVATLALSMIGAVSASNTAQQYYEFEPITDWLVTRQLVENYPAEKQIQITPPWLQRAYNDLEKTEFVGYATDQSLSRLVFTSGTTGRPKAVPLTVEQLIYRTKQGLSKLAVGGAILAIYDLGSAAGFLRFTADMLRGAPYLTMGVKRDPRNVVQLSKLVEIEALQGSPAQVQGFMDTFLRSPFDFQHLKSVRSGGAAVPADLQRFIQSRFGFPLEVGYGSTEAGYMAARFKNSEVDSRDVGETYEGVHIEIVNEEHQPVPAGEIGIVRVKTPDTVTGYFKDEEATAKAFRDGWFYPGDTGYIAANGNLVVGGRVSELINLGGVKLDPIDLDELAAEASGLRAASEIAAFGFHDDRGILRLGFAHQSDVKIDKKAIERAIQKKYRISDLWFIALAILPINDSGKVNRSSLSEMASGKIR